MCSCAASVFLRPGVHEYMRSCALLRFLTSSRIRAYVFALLRSCISAFLSPGFAWIFLTCLEATCVSLASSWIPGDSRDSFHVLRKLVPNFVKGVSGGWEITIHIVLHDYMKVISHVRHSTLNPKPESLNPKP